ncbi:MAG: hypothetical protein HYY24_26480 [Verrucomicrobia bacterium]|nr:hypothetical protein [Verrucomicrobiota bacterium]
MEGALKIFNELVAVRLAEQYAIGGAMAGYFYSEVVITEDLDAFVLLSKPQSGLITLTPIYDFLRARGAVERREHLLLAGILVQVVPAYDALTEEAVRQAVPRQVGATPTRVMQVEHLIAIALRTGRAKDRARVALLLEEAPVDSERLSNILTRHDLNDRWKSFKQSSP